LISESHGSVTFTEHNNLWAWKAKANMTCHTNFYVLNEFYKVAVIFIIGHQVLNSTSVTKVSECDLSLGRK